MSNPWLFAKGLLLDSINKIWNDFHIYDAIVTKILVDDKYFGVRTYRRQHSNKEKKRKFRTSLDLSVLFLRSPSFSHTRWKICVGVGYSWALYDGVGVWPVAGVGEKWPGTEYGKRCYNSFHTTHRLAVSVLDVEENTICNENREVTITVPSKKYYFLKTA